MKRISTFAVLFLAAVPWSAALAQPIQGEPGTPGLQDVAVADAEERPGYFVSADYLYWKPTRLTEYAFFGNLQNPMQAQLQNLSVLTVDFDRAPGMKIGMGYRGVSGWDITFSGAFLTSDGSAAINSPGNVVGFLNPLAAVTNEVFADSATATLGLEYDTLDIEFGRAFSFGDTAAFRLFGGFRRATISQDFNVTYAGGDFAQNGALTVNNITDLDAYGIRIGASGNCNIGWGIALFAQGAGSVLSGHFERTQRISQDVFSAAVFNTFNEMLPVLEASAGASWRRGPVELVVGYDLATWFNAEQRIEVVGVTPVRVSDSLSFDGLFARASFIF